MQPGVAGVAQHHKVAPALGGEASEDLRGMAGHDFELDRQPPGVGLALDRMLELAEVVVLVALLLLYLTDGSRIGGQPLLHRDDQHFGARERGQVKGALQRALGRLRPVNPDEDAREHKLLPSAQASTTGAAAAISTPGVGVTNVTGGSK